MNFEDIVREMEELKRRIMEETFGDFEDMGKRLETGELRGKWYIEPIDKPGMNGFIARGFFTTPEPLTRPPSILPPMKPRLKDPREPFYDIKVGEDELQLYIELPGVEKEEIKIKAEPKKFEITAGSFQASIDLSKWILDTDNVTSEYRNGVLKVTIPNIKTEEHLL